uniref:Uncharacterized protein n=1 Tax=Macrostomum lignano TaxID=282301 RepID=A0A1I8IYJ7_9PLAT
MAALGMAVLEWRPGNGGLGNGGLGMAALEMAALEWRPWKWRPWEWRPWNGGPGAALGMAALGMAALEWRPYSTTFLATEDSSAVAKPKAKPAGRSHSFASRLRRAIIGGGGNGRRPVSTDRGGGGGGELPATSGLPSKQQPDVGGRISGGGGLSGSLRRLLSGRGLRGHKRRLRPQDQTAESSNPVSDRSGWNSEEIL